MKSDPCQRANWRRHIKTCRGCRVSIQRSFAHRLDAAWDAVRAQLPIGGDWSPATPEARAALRDLRAELARLADLLDGGTGDDIGDGMIPPVVWFGPGGAA